MYFVSALQGQATSFCPGARGAPTECKHGTKLPLYPRALTTSLPMRVIMRMLTTTYGESVISIPMCESGEPIGPMLKGTTYIVLPRMDPSNNRLRVAFICSGSIQLLFGPASVCLVVQTNVLSSTRATSDASERAR